MMDTVAILKRSFSCSRLGLSVISPDEHSFGSTPEIPSLVYVVQAEHLVAILEKIQDDIIVLKIPWFSIDGPGDQGKFDLLQEFPLDASSPADPFFGVLQ